MNNDSNSIYANFNLLSVLTSYVMMTLSIWKAPVDLSTKGYWGMAVFMLTLSLVNFIKYRLDGRSSQERINKIEAAKNEKILEEFVTDTK